MLREPQLPSSHVSSGMSILPPPAPRVESSEPSWHPYISGRQKLEEQKQDIPRHTVQAHSWHGEPGRKSRPVGQFQAAASGQADGLSRP